MNPFLDHKNSYMISYNFADLVIMWLSKYNLDFGTNEINSSCDISSKAMCDRKINRIYIRNYEFVISIYYNILTNKQEL